MLLRQFRRSNFKIALLTTVAIIGLHAKGFAAPIQYVRVCDAFGQGSFNIPGTDTCLRLSGGVQAGYGGTTTNFNVNPNFDVSGSGTVYGVNAMALFGVVQHRAFRRAKAAIFRRQNGWKYILSVQRRHV